MVWQKDKACFQASAVVPMRYSIFWDDTHGRPVASSS